MTITKSENAFKANGIACECMRILKPGKHCTVLTGDTRRNKHFVPITPRVLMSFLEADFIMRKDIIKPVEDEEFKGEIVWEQVRLLLVRHVHHTIKYHWM